MTDETRQSPAETVSHAGTPWRCFHCDDVFTSRSEASAHFGYQVDATPACKIAPDLRGLVKFMRWQEGQLQRYRSEDSDAARQFYALGGEHARALRCEEEKGYARGVADMSKEFNAVAIRERVVEGDGMWMTCSGCHESEDGHDVGHYPHSDVFGCKLGGGCGECGGIGAIWDTTDYGAMGETLAAEMNAVPPEAVSHDPVAWIAFAGNGNIQFWTADPDRAAAEKESGRDLRMFTLAELVALVAQLGAHERLQARIVEALGIEIWQGDLADAVASALGKQLTRSHRPEGER